MKVKIKKVPGQTTPYAYAGGGKVKKRSERFGALMGQYGGGGNVDCPSCPHSYAGGGSIEDPLLDDYTPITPYGGVPYLGYPGPQVPVEANNFDPTTAGPAWMDAREWMNKSENPRNMNPKYVPVNGSVAESLQQIQFNQHNDYDKPLYATSPWEGMPAEVGAQAATARQRGVYDVGTEMANRDMMDFEDNSGARRMITPSEPPGMEGNSMVGPTPAGPTIWDQPDAISQNILKNTPAGYNQREVASSTPGLMTGNIVGAAGTALGALGPLWATIQNRKGDKPHSNYYKQFGNDALESNRLSQLESAKAGSAARLNARIAANTSKAANRGSTSSLNVLRGLDAITDMGNDMNNANIDSSEAQRMIGLLQQRSALQNERDARVMGGEEVRDAGDRRDRDAYYSALAKNLADTGTSTQAYAKQLNTQRQNQQEMQLTNMLSRYGMQIRYDKNGNMVITNSKGETVSGTNG